MTESALEWLKGPATELSQPTLKTYVQVIEKHILSWLGDLPVSTLTAEDVSQWQARLVSEGVSPDPRARALKYLRMLLNWSVLTGYSTVNVAARVRMPKVPAPEPPKPLSPSSIERLRSSGETLELPYAVSLMGYAGLRPSETFALTWQNVGERSILIRSSKTNRVDSVAMLAPLAADLKRWRLQSGNPDATSLVIPRARGTEWTRTAMDNWRKRVFDPACHKAGIVATPYTLRHSFASLLTHAHYPITYVAAAMRHSPAMTLKHYAHVIADLDPAVRIDPEQAILQARREEHGNRQTL